MRLVPNGGAATALWVSGCVLLFFVLPGPVLAGIVLIVFAHLIQQEDA